MRDGERRKIGPFDVEFIPVTHSVPHAHAIALHTPQGVILHSGDFKLDLTPVDGRRTDLARIGEIAKTEGIRLLLADSTNAEEHGYSPSETSVGGVLRALFASHRDRRIITASFASHIHRLQQIIDAAVGEGRVVATLGLSIKKNVRLARELGILKVADTSLIDIEEIDRFPPERVCIISTGSQGEPMSALSLLARGDSKWLKSGERDTVILSSHAIPGNEFNVNRVIDGLLRAGTEVIHSGVADVHATGHAQADELKTYHSIARPEWFVPIHGEYRHLVAHAKLGEQMGVPRDHVILCEDGDMLELSDAGLALVGRVPAGFLYVDGIVGDVGQGVLRDRKVLAEEGVVVVVVTVDVVAGRGAHRPGDHHPRLGLRPGSRGPARRGVRRRVGGGGIVVVEGRARRRPAGARRAPGGRQVRERAHEAPPDDRSRGDGGVAPSPGCNPLSFGPVPNVRAPPCYGEPMAKRPPPRTSTSRATPPAPPARSARPPAKRTEQVFGASRRRPKARPQAAASRAAPIDDEDTTHRRSDVRGAIEGQEHEFAGLGLIALGVLIGLAVYVKLAGIVGRGVSNVLGWLTGLGRFVVPIAIIAVGVALFRPGQIRQRQRLQLGIAIATGALLGLLHVARGPEQMSTSLSALEDAGGWIGALIGAPLESLLSAVGASVLLVIALFGSFLIISRMSVRSVASGLGRGSRRVTRPISRLVRRAMGEISTLSSERDPTPTRPPFYDVEAEELEPPGTSTAIGSGSKKKAKGLPPPTLADAAVGAEQAELELGPGAQRGAWKLPPANYLIRTGAQAIDRAEVEARGRTLEESLASHGVETKLVGMTVGPTVTRFELELGAGVKVARVTSLQRDIAYAMAAIDVRILAPIPGRSAIGVEVPNHTRQLVSLGDILSGPEAKSATHPLDVAIGKDIAGRAVFLNLATTPHLLIAGATGAGKSSGINCIITSLLMRATPDQVRLILIDPKQVEMGQYNRLPHLLTQPVTNPKKAANALAWAVKEMERRYDLLFEVGFRDIGGYNSAFDRGELTAGPRHRDRVRAAALHRGRGRRAQRPDDGGRPRRRGVDHPHRPEGAGRRRAPHRGDPAAERERDHGRHQGERPGPHGVRRVEPHRQPGDPRSAGRREARRQGRHAAAPRELERGPAHPGLVRVGGGSAQGHRPLEATGTRGHLRGGGGGRRPRRHGWGGQLRQFVGRRR